MARRKRKKSEEMRKIFPIPRNLLCPCQTQQVCMREVPTFSLKFLVFRRDDDGPFIRFNSMKTPTVIPAKPCQVFVISQRL